MIRHFKMAANEECVKAVIPNAVLIEKGDAKSAPECERMRYGTLHYLLELIPIEFSCCQCFSPV